MCCRGTTPAGKGSQALGKCPCTDDEYLDDRHGDRSRPFRTCQ